MARRFLTISLALGLWALGALMLAGSAGFAFAAIVHRAGSDGWTTSVLISVALAGAGATVGGAGAWLMSSRGAAPRARDLSLDDESMWHS